MARIKSTFYCCDDDVHSVYFDSIEEASEFVDEVFCTGLSVNISPTRSLYYPPHAVMKVDNLVIEEDPNNG